MTTSLEDSSASKIPYAMRSFLRLTTDELNILLAKLESSVTTLACYPSKYNPESSVTFHEVCDVMDDLHYMWNEVFLLEKLRRGNNDSTR